MVSFRKLFTVLAVGLLLTAVASAQSNCSASATAPTVRAEGLAELVGTITVTCTSVPSSGSTTAYVQIKTDNPNITNRITSGDNPTVTGPGAPVLYVNPGTAGSDFTAVTQTAKFISPSGLNWDAIPLTFSGASTQMTIRIDNVRVNASQAGNGNAIRMFVTAYAVSGTEQLTNLVTNAQVTVANVQTGLVFATTPFAGAAQQCVTAAVPVDADTNTATPALPTLKFTPNFPTAFKTVAGEGAGATTGTRLVARFTGVPTNARLFVYRSNTNSNGGYTVSDPATTGSSLTTVTNWKEVKADSNGVFQASYTITSIDVNKLSEPVIIPVRVAYTDRPGVGSIKASGRLGPAGGSATASTSTDTAAANYQIPRFVDAAAGEGDVISIIACSTTLLFPWVTNSDMWVTGIVINNSNVDIQLPTGTFLFSGGNTAMAGQEGTCTLNYFPATLASGATAPPAQQLASVAPGRSAVVVLSSTSDAAYQNFQGYVVANCNFQRAHGFAFMTSGQNQGGVGYNALVLPTPRGNTENLGQ